MAGPSAAEFVTLFPQWATADTAAINLWIEQAALRFTPARFGLQWSMAAYLFTAHQLQSFNPARTDSSGDHEVRGAIASEAVLDQSRSYATPVDLARVPASLTWLTTTSYGLQLIGIIMSRQAVRGRVVLTGSSYPG